MTSRWALTSTGAGRKDGGSWGAAVRWGKGNIRNLFFAMVCGTCDGLKCELPVPRSLHARVYRDPRANKKRNEAVVAARLLFLAQLPLYCEPRTEAPCTVFTQNRNGGHLKWTFAGHSIGHLLSSGKAVLTVSYVAVVKFSDRPVSLAPARYMPDSALANTPFY